MLPQDTKRHRSSSLTISLTHSELRSQWVLMADNNLAIGGTLDVQRQTMLLYFAEPVSIHREKVRARFHFSLN